MGIEMAISSRLYVPKRLGTRMDVGFYELHLTVNCAIGFTYKIFLERPVCVIGGGSWTGWTGCSLFWVFSMHVAAV